MNQDVSGILLGISDQFSISAKILMGAEEWFYRQSMCGYACFLKNEWKERYRYCGKIRKHVAKYHGDIPSITTSPAVKSMYSKESVICSALDACYTSDTNVIYHVRNGINMLSERKELPCVVFLCGILDDFQNDANEIYDEKEKASYTAAHPPGIIVLDQALSKRYCNA